LHLREHTIALLEQYQKVHSDSSFLELFPQLTIFSVASNYRGWSGFSTKTPDVYFQEQNLKVTLLKPVTVDDLRRLTLQLGGYRDKGCVCVFGEQLETSLKSGWITVSHITALTVYAGAGIVAPAARNEVMVGRGMRFKSTGDIRLEIQEPASDQLVRSTLSLVMDLAHVVKSGHIDLHCESRTLETYTDSVSSHWQLSSQMTDMIV
jgi:hypothetical protein